MNTAKMLGAGGREALEFGDACWTIQHNINKQLQVNARNVILNTELLGRKFEDWLKDMHDRATTTKSNDEIVLMNWEETKEKFSLGVVTFVLQFLITKQFHDSRL